MSRDRRGARRRERQRRRRSGNRGGFEPVGAVRFTGIMGLFQRNMRTVFVAGIVVMVASVGGVILAPSGSSPQVPDTPTVTPTVTATESAGTATAVPADGIIRFYTAEPELAIDPTRQYEALIRTERGDVRITLLPEAAPNYVNNFVFLARNRFYDGLTFHRVVEGFVAQGGDPAVLDPLSATLHGPGYSLTEDENEVPFDAGVISMAKAGPIVNGSQFFVTLEATPALAAEFTVFGRVVDGLEILRGFAERNPQIPGQPPGVRILSIEITEQGE